MDTKMTPNEIMERNKERCAMEFQFYEDFLNAASEMELMGAKIPSTIGSYVITNTNDPGHTHNYTIAPCQTTASGNWWNEKPTPEQKLEGEKPMCYNKMPMSASVNVAAVSQPTVEMTQRDFFSDRIRQETSRIEREVLRPQFFMDADDEPRNYLELIERIKSDDFTVDDEAARRVKESPKSYWGSTWGIHWGKNKPDLDGFKTAVKALKQAAQDVIDEATLSPADKLLSLLQDFRKWTFSNDTVTANAGKKSAK